MHKPKYRLWKTRNQGFAEFKGHRVYFPGEYGTRESVDAYDRWWDRVSAIQSPDGLTVKIFGELYLDHCDRLYGAGHRTAAGAAGLAVREIINDPRWGSLPVLAFGPRSLREVQDHLARRKLARSTVNSRIAWVRRWFRWGVAEQLFGPEILQGLEAVSGLRRGRTTAREPSKREPVDWRDVEPVLGELSRHLKGAVVLQWYTGARSGSIVSARGDQFEPDAQVDRLLVWRPRHKTEYRGAELTIPIGPKCRETLDPILERAGKGPLFVPGESRHNGRAGRAYSTWSYRRAIVRAQDRCIRKSTQEGSYVPKRWTPHQLRHSKGRAIRERFGLEAAQAVLGHESIAATQIYSDRRMDLARQIALDEG